MARLERVVVPSLTAAARRPVRPSADAGSAAVPAPRTASTIAARGKPLRLTSQTVRPLGSFDWAIVGTGRGLSAPKGGRSLGSGFFSAPRARLPAAAETRTKAVAAIFLLVIIATLPSPRRPGPACGPPPSDWPRSGTWRQRGGGRRPSPRRSVREWC